MFDGFNKCLRLVASFFCAFSYDYIHEYHSHKNAKNRYYMNKYTYNLYIIALVSSESRCPPSGIWIFLYLDLYSVFSPFSFFSASKIDEGSKFVHVCYQYIDFKWMKIDVRGSTAQTVYQRKRVKASVTTGCVCSGNVISSIKGEKLRQLPSLRWYLHLWWIIYFKNPKVDTSRFEPIIDSMCTNNG